MKTLPYAPARPRSTRQLMLALAQSIAILAAIMWATSCAPRAYLPGTPNPLDEPGEMMPTVEELHRKNLQEITGNPTL